MERERQEEEAKSIKTRERRMIFFQKTKGWLCEESTGEALGK